MTSHNLQQQANGSETVVLSPQDQAALVRAINAGTNDTVLVPAGVVNEMHLRQEQNAWQDLGMVGTNSTSDVERPLSPEVFHRQETLKTSIRAAALAVLAATGIGGAGIVGYHKLNPHDVPGSSNPAAVAGDYTNAPAGSASGLGAPESSTTIVIDHGPEASEAPNIPGDTIPPTAPSAEAVPDSTLEVADSTTASSGTSTTEASTTSTVETTPASPTTIATTATTAAPTTSGPPSTSVETTASTAAPTTQTTRPPQTTGTTRPVTTITSGPPLTDAPTSRPDDTVVQVTLQSPTPSTT